MQQLIVKSFTSVTVTAGHGASIPDHDASKPHRQPFPWQRGHRGDKTTKQGWCLSLSCPPVLMSPHSWLYLPSSKLRSTNSVFLAGFYIRVSPAPWLWWVKPWNNELNSEILTHALNIKLYLLLINCSLDSFNHVFHFGHSWSSVEQTPPPSASMASPWAFPLWTACIREVTSSVSYMSTDPALTYDLSPFTIKAGTRYYR